MVPSGLCGFVPGAFVWAEARVDLSHSKCETPAAWQGTEGPFPDFSCSCLGPQEAGSLLAWVRTGPLMGCSPPPALGPCPFCLLDN